MERDGGYDYTPTETPLKQRFNFVLFIYGWWVHMKVEEALATIEKSSDQNLD